MARYLTNWLFRCLDWLFNFKKIKISLRLTKENNLEKSVSQINNQDDTLINKSSSENDNCLASKSHNNELFKGENNLNKSISQINNQDDNLINKPSNENDSCLANENENNELLKGKNNLIEMTSPISNQSHSTINKPLNEDNSNNENNIETPLLDKQIQVNENIV